MVAIILFRHFRLDLQLWYYRKNDKSWSKQPKASQRRQTWWIRVQAFVTTKYRQVGLMAAFKSASVTGMEVGPQSHQELPHEKLLWSCSVTWLCFIHTSTDFLQEKNINVFVYLTLRGSLIMLPMGDSFLPKIGHENV